MKKLRRFKEDSVDLTDPLKIEENPFGETRHIKLETGAKEPQALFPEIQSSIAEFEALIVWHVGANNERLPEPIEGIDSQYDAAKKRVADINAKLELYLSKIRELLGFKGSKEIKYAHTQF